MTEETKKLITAKMLSDVFNKKPIEFDEGGILCLVCENGTEWMFSTKEGPVNFSIYELKDRIEGWFIKNVSVYEAVYIDDLWELNVSGGILFDRFASSEEVYKLEALLKLYHAVKSDQ